MKKTGSRMAAAALVLAGSLLFLTPLPAVAQNQVVLFEPTQILRTCDNPASNFNCVEPNNFDKLWTFAQKEVRLRCVEGDTATLTAAGDPNDDGTGVIVDNIMYVNNIDVCNRGDGGAPIAGGDPDGNCFSDGSSATVNIPIQQTFNGIGTIFLRGHGELPDVIPDGTSTATFELTDWGAVYGNSRIVLNTTCAVDGDQGCTPGYWKNHLDAWPATGFSPDQTVGSVFAAAVAFPDSGSAALLDALRFRGGRGVEGGVRILLRAAVAALLDASHPDLFYPRSAGEVIADVDAALASGNRAIMLALAEQLDYDNNLGCPIN